MSLSQALNQFAQNLGRYHQRHILMTIGDNTQPIQGDLYLRLTIQVSNALYFDWNADTI